MEFYEVLEKRRTYRDFSDREVSDELLKRVIGAAFKARPTTTCGSLNSSWCVVEKTLPG